MPPPVPADPIAEHRFAKVADQPKRLSVIYPYHVKGEVLLRSIERAEASAATAGIAAQTEFIVVDDGSPAADAIAERLPETVLYVWQRKHGFGASRARNLGAKLANGACLLFLDPDILVEPGYVAAMLAGFDAHGERAVQCGYTDDYYFEHGPDPRVQFGVWERPNRPTRRFHQVASGNLALARALFWECGGFDEDLIYGEYEDTLLGHQLGRLPDTTVIFNSGMRARHVPHPPGLAHADGARTQEILRRKWPEFHHDYIERRSR